ncbi:MAG: hypothetical protein WC817_03365 [Patescibacteria group bacterium]|jgi:hypothetical protein
MKQTTKGLVVTLLLLISVAGYVWKQGATAVNVFGRIAIDFALEKLPILESLDATSKELFEIAIRKAVLCGDPAECYQEWEYTSASLFEAPCDPFEMRIVDSATGDRYHIVPGSQCRYGSGTDVFLPTLAIYRYDANGGILRIAGDNEVAWFKPGSGWEREMIPTDKANEMREIALRLAKAR